MINDFNKLELSTQLMRGLDKMGLQSPTKVQELAIGPMMQKKDLLVQAPTGTGKTAAFGIPVIEMTGVNKKNSSKRSFCALPGNWPYRRQACSKCFPHISRAFASFRSTGENLFSARSTIFAAGPRS